MLDKSMLDKSTIPTSSRRTKRIERDMTIATVIELAAALALPVLVIAAGHSDWVLPSIAITIGPLLLYLDHRVHIPRYRLVGWLLTIGPVILVATMSGTIGRTTRSATRSDWLRSSLSSLPVRSPDEHSSVA